MREDFLERAPVVVPKIIQQDAMSTLDARALLDEVIRFLVLCRRSAKSLSPSQRIDMAWHEMILCTKAYHEWCQLHLGAFVHHQPDMPGRKNPAAFMRTLGLYELHFGTLPIDIWGIDERPRGLASCGACENIGLEDVHVL